MSKHNRNKKQGFYSDNFWQSAAWNRATQQKNIDTILALALNRFRWIGLPETCDPAYLELCLTYMGTATIAHPDDMPDVWYSIMATSYSDLNAYGMPNTWRAMGMNGEVQFDANNENGVFIFNRKSDSNGFMRGNGVWNSLNLLARKLTAYERTEDSNLRQQVTPMLLTAPREKAMELANLYKQIAGGEPAILADDTFYESMNVNAISTQVPFICNDLNIAKQNTWNEIYKILGIQSLEFEKGERMVREEVTANTTATNIHLMNYLYPRRHAAEKLSELTGNKIEVVFNDDVESYNWIMENRIQIDTDGGEDVGLF